MAKEKITNVEAEAEVPKQSYSWAGVWYASEDALRKYLKEQCRNWAYILHDQDTTNEGLPKEPHYHFVATYEQRKSFQQVCRTTVAYRGDQNCLVEMVWRGLAPALEYLWHKNDSGKFQYDQRKVVISSKEWFERYIRGNDETENDRFVDDLLAPSKNFSVVSMARKYGRDFMRNMHSYMEFRKVALFEKMGGNALDYFVQDSQAEQFNDIVKEYEQ